jgi:hypothetical protein
MLFLNILTWLHQFSRVIVVFNLQILGVASIWGYSDILYYRIGYSRHWATVTVFFSFLSLIRVLVIYGYNTNLFLLKESKFARACARPQYAFQNGHSSSSGKAGAIFSFALDFVLQILGTASIWAWSEITGHRKSITEAHIWGHITEFFSAISLLRYMTNYLYQTRKMNETGESNKLLTPFGFYSCFEAGICFRTMDSTRELGAAMRMYLFQGTAHSSRVSSLLDPSKSRSLTTGLLLLCYGSGVAIHVVLTVILQVMGAGGAVWGMSEVLRYRTSPISNKYIEICSVASSFVIVHNVVDFLLSPVDHQQSENDTASLVAEMEIVRSIERQSSLEDEEESSGVDAY